MAIDETLEVLGYMESPNYLPSSCEDWASVLDYAHIIRKASSECRLHGIYVLRPRHDRLDSLVPVLYVCEADGEAAADRIHRLVWNQNIVPFVLVETPQTLRLYSGFRFHREGDGTAADPVARGVLDVVVSFNEVAERLSAFKADSIDKGLLWKAWGKQVTPGTRVDSRLLGNLRELDNNLRQSGLGMETCHALIGKFVYLRYLRDRGILSDRKMDKWGVDPSRLFSRRATLRDFWEVDERLGDWLNGSIFPMAAQARSAIRAPHLKHVAGVFAGDTPAGQLHLDFQAYDFSFIPIETLSVIYEQFLHTQGPGEERARGEALGAYYTPVPLVNFMLDELDEKRHLEEGMRVLDPACGSGAFLVQCYRRLVERKLSKEGRERLTPRELRGLLTDHIFGVDRDADACQVAELSLILTLLDYVEPPDLENKPQFCLPILGDRNIVRSDFFDLDSDWARVVGDRTFDWVIGNPPWIELSSERAPEETPAAWGWIQENADLPVGGNQLAEAFAWKATSHLAKRGVVGLLLPAMTLFKDESRLFRGKFFGQNEVWCVANFANLAYVLFAGRAQRPAAAFFYRRPTNGVVSYSILTYAPFVANQEANLPDRPGRKKETWSIVINSSEIREVPVGEAATGSMLPWKCAMWGSYRDARLLERTGGLQAKFESFAARNQIVAHEGIQLRPATAAAGTRLQSVPEVVGEKCIDFNRLRNCGRIFSFPREAVEVIEEERAYLRLRGGRAGLEVSRPPHIVLDAARRFAVYCDEFVLVPPRQVGIAGPPESQVLLRALSLYLSSDFAVYHQFLSSPEWGVSTNRATLHGLKQLPVPLDDLSTSELGEWAALQQQLAVASSVEHNADLYQGENVGEEQIAELVDELNERVFDLLGLRGSERAVVEDLVNIRMEMVHGKVTKRASAPPCPKEIREYLTALVAELDRFIEDYPGFAHSAVAVQDGNSAMVVVDLCRGEARRGKTDVMSADDSTAEEFAAVRQNVRKRHSQWLYFDRSLRVYDGSRTYHFKPLQRIHWTKTQALLDAGEIVAETLAEVEAGLG